MEKFLPSADGTQIHYQRSGSGSTVLLFVHGWLGNSSWWDAQRDFFQGKFTVAQMDLGGHGRSAPRKVYSAVSYADDIVAVAADLKAKELIVVGHSMSGAYMLEAAPRLKNLKLLVAVDTLKNIEQAMTPQQAEEFLFQHYRRDYKGTLTSVGAKFLFSPGSPPAVIDRLMREFLSVDAEGAIQRLKPLYDMDLRAVAARVKVPVHAINSEFSPTSVEVNKKYLAFSNSPLSGPGHYPMLEAPQAFNIALGKILTR